MVKKTKVTAEEFRNRISWVGDCLRSCVSAPDDHSRRLEVQRLEGAVAELEQAECGRCRQYDRDRAALLLPQAKTKLAEYTARFQAADANLSRMAFAEEWR